MGEEIRKSRSLLCMEKRRTLELLQRRRIQRRLCLYTTQGDRHRAPTARRTAIATIHTVRYSMVRV